MTRGYTKSEFYQMPAGEKSALQVELRRWHSYGLRYTHIALAMGLPYPLVSRWGREMGLAKPKFKNPRPSRAKHPKPAFVALPGEQWRDVLGWEGRYYVSDYGRVRSASGRVLTRKPDSKGYYWHGLRCDGREECRSAHSMVLEAFVGPRPPGAIVRHLDGSRSNMLSNLEWSSHSQNMLDRNVHAKQREGVPA